MRARIPLQLFGIACCTFPPLSPVFGQTVPIDDDQKRMADISPASGPQRDTVETPPSSLSIRLGDTFDLQSQRKFFRFPPPNLNLPEAINRLFVDLRWQQSIGPDLTVHASNRLNYIRASKSGGAVCNCFRNDMRELYATATVGRSAFLDVGWINFRAGVGSSFNPTDIFKDRAVLDFDTADTSVLRESRLGVFMVRGQYVFDGGSLTLAYAPRLSTPTPLGEQASTFSLRTGILNSDDRLLAKLNLRLGSDFAPELIVAYTRGSWLIGGNVTRGIGSHMTAYVEAATTYRSGVVRSALDYAARTGSFPNDAALPMDVGDKSVRGQLAIGLNYTTNSKITLSAEYDYNGTGLSGGAWNRWVDQASQPDNNALRSALWYVRAYSQQFGEPLPIHSFLLRASRDDAITRGLSMAVLAVVSPSDRSAVMQLSASYDIKHGYSFGIVGYQNVGASASQFGSSPSSFGIAFSVSRYIQ